MLADLPDELVVIPVMPAASSDQMRPLGIYPGGQWHREAYDNGR